MDLNDSITILITTIIGIMIINILVHMKNIEKRISLLVLQNAIRIEKIEKQISLIEQKIESKTSQIQEKFLYLY